jgi:hypothetical protein
VRDARLPLELRRGALRGGQAVQAVPAIAVSEPAASCEWVGYTKSELCAQHTVGA